MSGQVAEDEATALAPTERLSIPHRKRLSHSYRVTQGGARELRIDYGVKEILFDEERMFAFGEQLIRTPSFTGELAMTWGPGYTWDELLPMLEALVDEGILRRGDGDDDPRGGGLVDSQVPASVCPQPRMWSLAECEAITRDLGGRPIEVGYLEAVLPMFRIAHPALDADGRQVGEGNVFPAALRLDRETEWRVCQYSGTRYRDDRPMNVTALRAMIKHWKPMMATLLRVTDEVRAREPADRAWTIGELHTLSCVVLGLPAYQLLKGGGTSPQVPLHPVLSSMFRITDGIRMTTHQLLFSVEKLRRADEPLTADQLYQHVEDTGAFIGDTGVCSGPRPMVDEFLKTVVDGVPPEGIAGLVLPEPVQDLVDELAAAVDYGLYALQSWAVSVSTWLAMSRAYEAVIRVFDAHRNTSDGGRHARLRARLRRDWGVLTRMQVDADLNRGVHDKGYLDAYERSWRMLRAPLGPPTLAQAVAARPPGAMHAAAANQLRSLLANQLALSELAEGALDQLTGAVMHYVREEQAILASILAIQEAINALLDRPAATRPLRARDLHASFAIATSARAFFPYLFYALEDELGITVSCTASSIEVSPRVSPERTTPADRPAHSAQA